MLLQVANVLSSPDRVADLAAERENAMLRDDALRKADLSGPRHVAAHPAFRPVERRLAPREDAVAVDAVTIPKDECRRSIARDEDATERLVGRCQRTIVRGRTLLTQEELADIGLDADAGLVVGDARRHTRGHEGGERDRKSEQKRNEPLHGRPPICLCSLGCEVLQGYYISRKNCIQTLYTICWNLSSSSPDI